MKISNQAIGKKTIITCLSLGFLCLLSAEIYSYSSGALEVIGAPNETGNCTNCHYGAANSDTKGSINLSVEGNPTQYNPGQTYTINVTMNYTGKNRFGFALNARKQGVLFNTKGSFVPESGTGVSFSNYVTHLASSINSSNTKTWKIKWTAPSTNDTIVFYASGLASNNDGTNSGDITYTASKSFVSSGKSAIEENEIIVSPIIEVKQLFPNPTNGEININFSIKKAANYTIELLDTKGAVLEILMDNNLNEGLQQFNYQLKNEYSKGIYFVKISTDKSTTLKRIVIL